MPFLLPDTPVARSMSPLSIPSSPPTEEPYSNSPNLGGGSQGGSLENPEGQLFTHKGKFEHEVTKDSTDHFSCTTSMVDKHDKTYKCSALDCKRNQGFASLTILRRHETEIHGMHKTGQKLHCLLPTCERHNGKGFQINEQLENHIRLKHPRDGDNLGRRLKRKADVDWDESFRISSISERTQETLAINLLPGRCSRRRWCFLSKSYRKMRARPEKMVSKRLQWLTRMDEGA
jgi:hypothetical protein